LLWTFRLVLPAARHAALARDYATMAPMFIGVPIDFDVILRRLQAAEQQLNDGSFVTSDPHVVGVALNTPQKIQ
jgi:hypothetical protein